jgi:putative tryptophan/tyrosine transport system substrate-binding protein
MTVQRRSVIGALGVAMLASPKFLRAEAGRAPYRIGILTAANSTSGMLGPRPENVYVRALLRGLNELGYAYDAQFTTIVRSAEGSPEHFAAAADELIRARVDVIASGGGPVLGALQRATSTIPVVMAASVDPVGLGFVRTLAVPGGNFTGLSLQSTETTGKRLELLKEMVPTDAPVAVLFDRSSVADRAAAEAAAGARGWKLVALEVSDVGAIETALQAAIDAQADALLVLGAGIFFPHARRLADLAIRRRLPTMYGLRPYVDAGGLMSYGADIVDIWHRAASFVDKIFKGARPAELPVEQPAKFELAINSNTARSLGLAIPPALLLRADVLVS